MNSKVPYTIFVLDDERWYGSMIQNFLALNPDYYVERFEHAGKLIKELHRSPAVITIDFSMPDMDGTLVLKEIRKALPEVPVIIISGQDDVKTAIGLLKQGAYDYIVKDSETTDRLWSVLQHIRKMQHLQQRVDTLEKEVGKKYSFSNTMIGQSATMKTVFSLTEKAAQSNITVSITGDTGTGKEVVAKAIHYNSARKNQPFVAVNVAAIPKDLLESELFGYEKGAFTGANTRRIGRFEEADKGTLFLDEIAELDISLQAKLLRALQERIITRLGGNKEVPVDVRIIVASHQDLHQAMLAKRFREDLYYRLLGLPIVLPALRGRGNDILLLASNFIAQYCSENQQPLKTLSDSAAQKLLQYSFPGNVRELKSMIELAMVLSAGNTITANDINTRSDDNLNIVLLNEKTMKEYEWHIIETFLEKYDNNVVLVADKLGIGKSSIYRMLQTLKETIK